MYCLYSLHVYNLVAFFSRVFYYEDESDSQQKTDNMILDVACLLGVCRHLLGITSTSNPVGSVAGNLKIRFMTIADVMFLFI
jgi:DNA topoisomerase VI subunit A